MESKLVPQWTEKAKNSLAYWKQISETGMEAMEKVTAQVISFQNAALMGKTALVAAAELRRTQEYLLNRFLRSQISMLPLQASAALMRDFGAVYADAATRLTKQQMDLLNICIDGISDYFETLKKSRSSIDMMTAQINFFTEIQQKTKDNVMDTMMIFEGVKTASNAVVESSLDNMQTGDATAKSK